MLDNLSTSLKDALKKLAGKTVIDRAAVDELVKDLQRALISSDVNVKLVMELSKAIRTRSLDEQLPKGTNVREHVLRIVYQELVRLVWASTDVKLEPRPSSWRDYRVAVRPQQQQNSPATSRKKG